MANANRRLQLIKKVRRLREEYFRAFDELIEVTVSFDESEGEGRDVNGTND